MTAFMALNGGPPVSIHYDAHVRMTASGTEEIID